MKHLKTSIMKTFKDLEFKNKFGEIEISLIPSVADAKQAVLYFDNGYSVSVICGYGAYGDSENPYELAIVKDGELCYDTYITDDVCGYLTEEKVTETMIKIQNL